MYPSLCIMFGCGTRELFGVVLFQKISLTICVASAQHSLSAMFDGTVHQQSCMLVDSEMDRQWREWFGEFDEDAASSSSDWIAPMTPPDPPPRPFEIAAPATPELASEDKDTGPFQMPKKFRCSVCSCSCSRWANLKEHEARIHGIGSASVRPTHLCDLCSYQTNKKSNLSEHKARMHGVGLKLLQCPQCRGSFKPKSDLKKHEAARHLIGARYFSCDICSRSFKRAAQLRLHRFRVHGSTDDVQVLHV